MSIGIGPAAATPAIVVDVIADLLPIKNHQGFIRMVLNPGNAENLLAALQQQLGETK